MVVELQGSQFEGDIPVVDIQIADIQVEVVHRDMEGTAVMDSHLQENVCFFCRSRRNLMT